MPDLASVGTPAYRSGMSVQILPATADRFDDAEHALTGGGDGPSCQCQWWTLRNEPFRTTTKEEKIEMLRAELATEPSLGLIAYVDGTPAGWVRVGPRVRQARIAATRMITANSPEPLDDPSVWAVTCFVVRKEHRGSGLMARLLDAAVSHARDGGARAVEAYPFDPTVKKRPANELYHGVLQVFTDAGFDIVAQPRPDRALVSLTLDA